MRADTSLIPPIRQTASIFKQPVTVVRSQDGDSKVKRELQHGSQVKPKQLFWEKRLEVGCSYGSNSLGSKLKPPLSVAESSRQQHIQRGDRRPGTAQTIEIRRAGCQRGHGSAVVGHRAPPQHTSSDGPNGFQNVSQHQRGGFSQPRPAVNARGNGNRR